MITLRKRTIAALAIASCFTALSGCASTGPERAAAAAGSLNELSSMVEKTQGQLQTAVTALNDLVQNPKPDLQSQYRTYVDSLSALDQRVKEMTTQAEAIKTRGQAYFAAWEKEAGEIKSEELKAHAAERRAALSARYDAIKADVARVAEIGKPLVVSLKDVQKVLSMDLSPAGLELAEKPAKQAKSSAADLKTEVEKLRKQLGEVSKLLAPAAPPAPAPKPAEASAPPPAKK